MHNLNAPAPVASGQVAQRDEVRACIGIGANLGDARATVATALRCLGETLGDTRTLAASRLYASPPLVDAGTPEPGPPYVNAALLVATRLNAPALLRALQAAEVAAGRKRPYRHAPRTLDLDLLLYGGARIASPELTVPHPRLHERAFVLAPLADLGCNGVAASILADLMVAQGVKLLDSPPARAGAGHGGGGGQLPIITFHGKP